MKPFDLEKALAGEAVITRDGREATQITKFNVDRRLCICAVISGRIHSFATDGSCMDYETDRDLFMAPKKHVYWVNMYPNNRVQPATHKSRENADFGCEPDRIACLRIEFEEGEGL